MKLEARLQCLDRDSGRLVWADVAGEAFDPSSPLTDDQIWNRYLRPAFSVVRREMRRSLEQESANAK